MQGGNDSVQESVRRIMGLFGQLLVELTTLMGTQTGRVADGPQGPGAAPEAEASRGPAAAPEAEASREPAAAPEAEASREPAAAPEPTASEVEGPSEPTASREPDDLDARIAAAVEAGLAKMLTHEPPDALGDVSTSEGEATSRRVVTPEGLAEPHAFEAAPEPQGPPSEAAPVPHAPPSETPPERQAPPAAPDATAADAGQRGRETTSERGGDLFLVCRDEQGRHLAVPWNWVVDTHLSSTGTPEAFTLSNGSVEKRMAVGSVVGIWNETELRSWREQVEWIVELGGFAPPAASREAGHEQRERPESPEPPEPHERPEPPKRPGPPEPPAGGTAETSALGKDPAVETEAASSGAPEIEDSGAAPAAHLGPIWVVSPSALARRFLMRHLESTGLDIREARDLDDPLLPADLGSVGALFLDESLREQWRDHPSHRAGGVPLVLLTVDGALHVPRDGERPESGAVLPRPFERAEVEAVIAWLRSVWRAGGAAGDEDHGDEEDDTWLFADPFGSSTP